NGIDPDPDHDGNPGNNGTPTPIVIPAAPITPVPALGTFAAVVLGLLTVLLVGTRIHRRRRI
ncbi:MAG: hypothetical protein ABI451_08445, partial [Dokdonella sp.]